MSAAASLLACATPLPPPEPEMPESAGIGIRVKVYAALGIASQAAQAVYFVRLPDGAESIRETEVISSNYARDGYVYLLNAPPGRYAAVAMSRVDEGHVSSSAGEHVGGGVSVGVTLSVPDFHKSTFFEEKLIRMTGVEVEAGSIAFMGEYSVDESWGWGGADETQLHYRRLLIPGAEEKSGTSRLFSTAQHYRGSLHEGNRDDEAQARFRKSAAEHLAAAGWSGMLH
jgi:hypothetical protein